jgi:hypothetical protein
LKGAVLHLRDLRHRAALKCCSTLPLLLQRVPLPLPLLVLGLAGYQLIGVCCGVGPIHLLLVLVVVLLAQPPLPVRGWVAGLLGAVWHVDVGNPSFAHLPASALAPAAAAAVAAAAAAAAVAAAAAAECHLPSPLLLLPPNLCPVLA